MKRIKQRRNNNKQNESPTTKLPSQPQNSESINHPFFVVPMKPDVLGVAVGGTCCGTLLNNNKTKTKGL